MKEITLIKIDENGNINGLIISNDKNIILENDKTIVDITKSKNKEKIKENPKHFKFKDKKISELSEIEKEKVDEESKPPVQQNTVYDLVKNLSDRLDKIEKELKVKK